MSSVLRIAGLEGTAATTPGAMDTWTPEPWEEALVVLGCAGSSGATTVALAMGLAAIVPVRVVECGSVTTSGLAAASTAELGLHPERRLVAGAPRSYPA